MAELGWFMDRRVHLLDGEIFEISPQNHPHELASSKSEDAIKALFSGPEFWVRFQKSLIVGLDTDPEPDIAVVPGPRERYTQRPTSALLVVEVSDSALEHDQTLKAALYARGGVADYWIVNVVDRQLEVRRRPIADDADPHGFRYAESTVIKPGESASPLAAPDGRVAVADLLP